MARKLRLELPEAGTPPPAGELAAALPADACFLDFYRYSHSTQDPQVKGMKDQRRTPRYVAFLVVRGRPATRVELGEAASLEKAWAAWHHAILNEAPAKAERQAAAAVAKLIWEPLRAKLPPGTNTLYLAPDGVLTQVPWATLPGSKPDTVLLEVYTFASVLHGPFLLDRLTRQDKARPPGGALLAVGVGLRLDKLDLAVLSACETGLGEVGGGEGVHGLQRAFHVAGCKDVIASLWAVEDDATAALMTLFYTNLWLCGDDPLQALRKAQLDLYRHPGQIKSLAQRRDGLEEVPLAKVRADGPRARTAQWAAFTFSGIAAPPARAGR